MDLKIGEVAHLITEVIGCTVIEEAGPGARAGSGAEAGAGVGADICLDHHPRSTTRVGAEAGPGLGADICPNLRPRNTAEMNIILMGLMISSLSQLTIERKGIAHLQVVKPSQVILMVKIVSKLIQQPLEIVPLSRKGKI